MFNHSKKATKIFTFYFLLFTISCGNETPESAAKVYCDCMNSNLTKSSETVAMTICEAKLIDKFYYYKLEKIILPMEENPDFAVSTEEKEKARQFFITLDSLVYRSCNRNMR